MGLIDLTEVEREICRLPDVSIARIVADDAGNVTEVHIVAHSGKHPKQIVRDVQSVALASFGLEIDRRVVSVVQLDVEREPSRGHAAAGPARVTIATITAEHAGVHAIVRVALCRDDDVVVGMAEGSIATTARHRLVALATIDALRQLSPVAEAIDVDNAAVVRVGAVDVAVVTIVFIAPPNEHVVSGSAIVHARNESDAVARAVLDATNRRLAAHARNGTDPGLGAASHTSDAPAEPADR
jgi:hypothetical protein